MFVLLLACWSPDPVAAPVQLPELDPILSGAATEATGGVEDTDPAADDTDTDGDTDAGDDTDAPVLPPFDAYPATTTSAPVTIVDDYGKPLVVIQGSGVAVTVLGEEPIRKRVLCTGCPAVVEGWVQPSVVTERKK